MAASPERAAVAHDATSERPLPSRGWWIAVAVALVPFLLLAWKFDFMNDDAYIAFRYGKNLALGEGLRFNPGTNPPVEGYSQLLWVLWLGLLAWLGLDITVWARVTTVCAGVLLIVWMLAFLRRRFRFAAPTLAVLGLVLATLPPMTIWATGGLETMCQALFVFGVFERLLGDPGRPRGWQAGAFGVLAALTRVDGVGFVAFLAAGALLRWLEERDGRLLRATGILLACTFGAVAAQTLWRWGYYHDLVPNTAHVKAGFHPERFLRGWEYVVSLLLVVPTLLLCGAAGVAAAGRRHGALVLQVLCLAAGAAAYCVWVGGDFMPMGRLLVPAVPFCVVLLAVFFDRYARQTLVRVALGLGLVALSLMPQWNHHAVPLSWLEGLYFRWSEPQFETEVEYWAKMKNITGWWVDVGRALKLHTDPGESIVLYGVGAIGYYSDLYVYDMYGLTNREAAEAARFLTHASPSHDKGVPRDFFLPCRPTYWLATIGPHGDRELDFSMFHEKQPWMRNMRALRFPLQEADGFPPNSDLIVGHLIDGAAAEPPPAPSAADANEG